MNYPKQLYVYVCDHVDGEPLYAVADELGEIPEDQDGNKVATYTLRESGKFVVSRAVLGEKVKVKGNGKGKGKGK